MVTAGHPLLRHLSSRSRGERRRSHECLPRVARLAPPPLRQPRVHRATWGPPEALSPPPTPSPLDSLSSRSSWDLSHLLTSAHSRRFLGF